MRGVVAERRPKMERSIQSRHFALMSKTPSFDPASSCMRQKDDPAGQLRHDEEGLSRLELERSQQ